MTALSLGALLFAGTLNPLLRGEGNYAIAAPVFVSDEGYVVI
jgi:hypothetical protein